LVCILWSRVYCVQDFVVPCILAWHSEVGYWIGCSTMNEYASVCKQNKMISLIDSNDYIISLQNFQISRRTTDCHTLLAHSSTLAGISKQRSSLVLAHVILTGKTCCLPGCKHWMKMCMFSNN